MTDENEEAETATVALLRKIARRLSRIEKRLGLLEERAGLTDIELGALRLRVAHVTRDQRRSGES